MTIAGLIELRNLASHAADCSDSSHLRSEGASRARMESLPGVSSMGVHLNFPLSQRLATIP